MGSNPVADRLRGTDPDPRIEKFAEEHGLNEDAAFALYDLVIHFVEETGPEPVGAWRHELERLRKANTTLLKEQAERHQAALEAVRAVNEAEEMTQDEQMYCDPAFAPKPEEMCPWDCGALVHNYVCEKMKETPYPEVPRRAFLDRMTPAEKMIYDAVQVVEGLGADVRLTQAVVKLGEARSHLADFLDGITPAYEAPEIRPTVPRAVYEETCDQLRAATDEGSLTRQLGALQTSARALIEVLPHPYTALEACRDLAALLGMTEEDLARPRLVRAGRAREVELFAAAREVSSDVYGSSMQDWPQFKRLREAVNAYLPNGIPTPTTPTDLVEAVRAYIDAEDLDRIAEFDAMVAALEAAEKTASDETPPEKYPIGELGTLDGEAHREDVSARLLDEAERYTLECFRESREGLPFNGRYLLSMIREIRRWRDSNPEVMNTPRPARVAQTEDERLLTSIGHYVTMWAEGDDAGHSLGHIRELLSQPGTATRMPEDFVADILRREGLEATPAILAGIHAAYRYGLSGYDESTATRGRTEVVRKERVLTGDSIDDSAAKMAYDFIDRNSVRMQIHDQAQVADLLAVTLRLYVDYVLRDPDRMPNARHRRRVAEDLRKYSRNLHVKIQKQLGITPSLLMSAADYIYPKEPS